MTELEQSLAEVTRRYTATYNELTEAIENATKNSVEVEALKPALERFDTARRAYHAALKAHGFPAPQQ